MRHHRYDTCGEISAVYDQRLYKRSREIPERGREDGSLEACWKQLGGRRCHINIYVNLLFFKTNVGTRAAIVTSGGMRSEWFDFPQTPSSSSRHIRRVRPNCAHWLLSCVAVSVPRRAFCFRHGPSRDRPITYSSQAQASTLFFVFLFLFF